jgi:hypothetical protein
MSYMLLIAGSDNILTIYITAVLYDSLQKKTAETNQRRAVTLYYTIALIMLDTIGFALFFYHEIKYSDPLDDAKRVWITASICVINVHLILMINVFLSLIDLKFGSLRLVLKQKQLELKYTR